MAANHCPGKETVVVIGVATRARELVELLLAEGRLLKDYRTDKRHYRATTVRQLGYKWPTKVPENDGSFILGPVEPRYDLQRRFEKDFPTEYSDLPAGEKSKPWRHRNLYNGPHFTVDHSKGVVNLDAEDLEKEQHRRRDPDRESVSWSILEPSTTSLRGGGFSELIKLVRDVVRIDPGIIGFSIVGSDTLDGYTVGDLLKERSPEQRWSQPKTDEPWYFYHGTSQPRAEQIVRKGLRPGNSPDTYSDLVPGYSDLNVYLSSSAEGARNYASRAAVQDKDKAAVLQVQVPDWTRLVPDEDNLGGTRDLPGGIEFSDKFLDGEDTHFRDFDKWNSHPQSARIRRFFQNHVKRSLRRGTVAYRGTILPKFVKLIQTYSPVRMPRDPSREKYLDAQAKTRSSASEYGRMGSEVLSKRES